MIKLTEINERSGCERGAVYVNPIHVSRFRYIPEPTAVTNITMADGGHFFVTETPRQILHLIAASRHDGNHSTDDL